MPKLFRMRAMEQEVIRVSSSCLQKEHFSSSIKPILYSLVLVNRMALTNFVLKGF